MLDCSANSRPGAEDRRGNGLPVSRLFHLGKTDPMAGPSWGWQRGASMDIDYLANNGSALDQAIVEDAVDNKGLG